MHESQGYTGLGDRLTKGPASELIASAFALETGDGPPLCSVMSLADRSRDGVERGGMR